MQMGLNDWEQGIGRAADEGENGPGPEESRDYLSFVRILNRHNIPYCMDSGVLLGLMREGRLFSHEKDVDLQMWAENEERLRELLPVFREAGYQVTIWLYKDIIYQYRFAKEGKIPVHIMLFRRCGNWAWCPAGKGLGPPRPRRLTRRFYVLFVRARIKLRRHLVATDVVKWPWNVRRQLGTWWVPRWFFDRLIFHERFETYIPRRWEEYLAYRYDSWLIPNPKWKFWRDDGALRHEWPEEIVDLSRYRNGPAGENIRALRSRVRGN